jgi:D-alanyl-D-alanine carboxypeptidase
MNRNPIKFFWTLILIVLLFPASIRADRVDQFIKEQMRKRKIPGLSLAVVRNGRVVKARGYGFANLELQVPASKHTIYEIGSISKQFTATAIMLLVEEGKLKLEDKLIKYLPNIPAIWHGLTIRQCLNMTTGIRGHAEVPEFSMREDYTAEEFIKLFETTPLIIKPGEGWYYTSTGYNLLGIVIEKISGKTYEEFVEERIFKPLSLSSTRVKNVKEIVKNRADGYTFNAEGELIKSEPHRPKIIAPSGGILSNIIDLCKLDATLYTTRMLGRSSLKEMWSPVRVKNGTIHPYGLGWKVEEFRGHKLISHSGGMPGFTSMFSRYVDDKLSIIILTNRYNARAYRLAKAVAGIYIPGLSLSSLKPKRDPNPEITKRLTQSLHSLVNDDAEVDLATSFETKNEINEDLKHIKSFKFLEKEDVPEDKLYRNDKMVRQIYRYKMLTGQAPRYYTFELDAAGNVLWITSEDW